jgi:hypothetical protein
MAPVMGVNTFECCEIFEVMWIVPFYLFSMFSGRGERPERTGIIRKISVFEKPNSQSMRYIRQRIIVRLCRHFEWPDCIAIQPGKIRIQGVALLKGRVQG